MFWIIRNFLGNAMRNGEDHHVFLITVRRPDMLIPGGSLILGEVRRGRLISRGGHKLPPKLRSAITDLADAMKKDEELPAVVIHKPRRKTFSLFIVAFNEEQAALAAMEWGMQKRGCSGDDWNLRPRALNPLKLRPIVV